ncbi:hypothetical protein J2741_002570 [Methanolinea mesophila]|uniref:nitrophenyl compound nitroreductase subunit ArsF family protein n=1 Tax=Methanolinea mesophila TaxID=547055 RepID=UPI001AE248DC|nr:nitrophenyl compound nitroreductase subunit ArsF family protein [Methanolinea mesophila]MBP1929974.1 hypothetical protein [Methanolinea mesophila]
MNPERKRPGVFATLSGKTLPVLCVMVALVVATLFIAGCVSDAPGSDIGPNPGLNVSSIESSGGSGSDLPVRADRVEVYHFHRTQQCYSCTTVGAYAEETVKTRFAGELESGKIVFGHINIELPGNRDLVERYGPTGPSLWIGVYDENGFHKEEDTRVWYKIGNKDDYIGYLSGIIAKRQHGDFS